MFPFAEPQWFLLLLVLALLAWRIPRLGLLSPLRLLCAGLMILWLASPQLRISSAGTDLWVLMDRSDSAAEAMASSGQEWEAILGESRQPADRLFFVDFAAAPVLREPGTVFEPATGSTALRLAAGFALAQRDKSRQTKLLALTDGYSTEDLAGLDSTLRSHETPMDIRLFPAPVGEDFRVGEIEAPRRVAPGQGFLLQASVFGTKDDDLDYEVLCDNVKVGGGRVAVRGGRGTLRLSGRLESGGARRYEIRILPKSDTRPGNNAAGHWVEVTTSGTVLLITAYADDPLSGVLKAAGFAVETILDPQNLHPGYLAGPRVVILNNVPAHELPPEFLASLDFFVREQGGGLLMAGGRKSFGSGGYFESPLDALLPVSMELRQEHRKLAMAMAIVMDRSGSMSAAVSAGTTKMDLANEGAARAIQLLGPADAVTVFAVDSEPHVVIPLSKIGPDAAKMAQSVRRVQSAGGGIFVYRGLEAAWSELQKSEAGQRHVVLFSDAADSEVPGEYQSLIAEMTAEGTTLSVIALGTKSDPDAALLEEIARLGNGRIFFNADATQLPGLFAQETVSVARSAFLDALVAVVDAGGWSQISPGSPAWLEAVDGYNLCYLRPEASVAAIAGDEYRAPLVAFWQRGAGKSAAVTFPLSGANSEAFRAWADASGFVQTLTRWLLPGPPAPGTALRTRFVGNELLVDFLHDQPLAAQFATSPPRLVVAAGSSATPRDIPWEKMENGRFSARMAVPPGQWLRGVVDAGPTRLSFGPLSPGTDPEWQQNPSTRRDLRDVSRSSGGREITELRDAWQAPARQTFQSLRNWVLLSLLLAFLAEVALTRWRGRPL
ncbi:MAG: vWA domain-containing protein [Terrimicrobiaceae bacterium]